MEWVSDDMNNAVNDGDGGEDDGRPISLVRYMANRDGVDITAEEGQKKG